MKQDINPIINQLIEKIRSALAASDYIMTPKRERRNAISSESFEEFIRKTEKNEKMQDLYK